MADLNFQDFSTVQSNLQPKPATIASAATIAPTSFLTFITGTVALETITPPVSGLHMLALIHTNGSPGTFVTTGNILTAVVPTQNIPTLLLYDPAQRKYYAWANNLT